MTIKSSDLLPSTSGKRLRFGIVEIYSHHVFVHTLALVARKCGMDVTIYTTPRLHKDMVPLFGDKHDEYTWIIADNGESDLHFMWRIKKLINSDIDLVCCNSVQGWRIILFWLFKFKITTIAGAGRISEFFGIRYKLFGHTSFRRFLHHNFTRFFLQKCIPRYKALITHTNQATSFSRENGYTRPIIQMPFSLYKEDVTYDQNKLGLHIVITGSIQALARDHQGSLDVCEHLWAAGYSNLKLTVLAGPKSEEGYKLVARMEQLKAKGYDVNFYTGWVDEDEFLRVADDADIFLSPLNLHYYSKGEMNSGTVESIRQGKACIYPHGYLIDPSLISSSMFYNSLDDLSNIIKTLLEDRDNVAKLSFKAIKNSGNYSLDTVAKVFSDFTDKII